MSSTTIGCKNHRFPPQIIAHAVWLYLRFPLSLRLFEEMLLERSTVLSHETIRRWGRKFGAAYAKQLRRKKPSRKDIWHLDEAVPSIGGRKYWLWRAVDQDGYVLDEIVQGRRDAKAAKQLLVRLLKKQGLTPKRIVTDKLRSHGRENGCDAGLSFGRRLATLYYRLFSGQKSFRPVSPETFHSRHTHSSHAQQRSRKL